MAREILFKAKRIDNGEWVEGIPIRTHIGLFMCFDENPHYCHMYGYMEIDRIIKVDENTLCQYTGLTDKNGNKIWENDIVRGNINGYKGVFVINWNDIECRFSFPTIARVKGNDYEVIGNIFDNHELLEGANSMTEQEAIKILNSKLHLDCKAAEAMGELEARDIGIKALEEVQQYRALGTVEELKELKEIDYDCSIKHLTGECSYNETGCSGCIGREKIKNALEKQIAKKLKHEACPNCSTNNDMIIKHLGNPQAHKFVYCWNCGQALEIG